MMQSDTPLDAELGAVIDTRFESEEFDRTITKLVETPRYLWRCYVNEIRSSGIKIAVISPGFDVPKRSDLEPSKARSQTFVFLLAYEDGVVSLGPSLFNKDALRELLAGAAVIALMTSYVEDCFYRFLSEQLSRAGEASYGVVIDSTSEFEQEWRAMIEPHRARASCFYCFGADEFETSSRRCGLRA